MRRWAEFYKFRNGGYQTALGSDSVAVLDARFTLNRSKWQAAAIGKQRGMDGFRLCRGSRFSEPFYLTAAVLPCSYEPLCAALTATPRRG